MKADIREINQLLDCLLILKDDPNNENIRNLAQHRHEELKRDLDKLYKLEKIEEESGLLNVQSSLIAFLSTPYIQDIMQLYVSARKEYRTK